MRRPWLLRFLALVLAVVQLALPPVVSVVDAQSGRAGQPTATAHIEGEGSASCPRVHESDCAICHYLTTYAAPGRPTSTLPAWRETATVRPESRVAAPRAARRALALPRAPPVS